MIKGQGHGGHVLKKAMNPIQTKPLCASLSNLAVMLTMVNPIDFGGHSSKVKVMMGIIDICWVRGDATLCIVISGIFSRFEKTCNSWKCNYP